MAYWNGYMVYSFKILHCPLLTTSCNVVIAPPLRWLGRLCQNLPKMLGYFWLILCSNWSQFYSNIKNTFIKYFCSQSGLPGQCPQILTINIPWMFLRIRLAPRIALTPPERAWFSAHCTLFEQIPWGMNRDILKNPTLCGAKNRNKLCEPSHFCPVDFPYWLWSSGLKGSFFFFFFFTSPVTGGISLHALVLFCLNEILFI